MSYKIIYGKDKNRHFPWKKLLVMAMVAAVIVLAASWFDSSLRQLPEAALENMVSAVQSGEPLSDAITTFCREIVSSAKELY